MKWRDEMVKAVMDRSPRWRSRDHGINHWDQVRKNGVALAEETPGADAEIVSLFALFHDSQRENEYTDPAHGARGADLAEELVSGLDEDRMEMLVYACIWHAEGMTSDNPTIGCCWDADRLDLGRVGITPDPTLMSTSEGRRRAQELREKEDDE